MAREPHAPAFLIAFAAGALVTLLAQPLTLSPQGRLTGALPADSLETLFCPRDACAARMETLWTSADESIDVAIYSFTLDGLANDLLEAKERGVKVRVLMDKTQAANSFSEDERLRGAGIPVRFGSGAGIMHNKFSVVDGKTVSTGSFNYSQNGDTLNNENLVIVHGSETASRFGHEFERLWALGLEAS